MSGPPVLVGSGPCCTGVGEGGGHFVRTPTSVDSQGHPPTSRPRASGAGPISPEGPGQDGPPSLP